jgi:hypothetical protein
MRASPRLAGVCLIAAAAAALGLTFAHPGPERRVKPVASASGILISSAPRDGEAILSAGDLAPGHLARGRVTIRNDSSNGGALSLTQRLRSETRGIGGGRLFDDLLLTIEQVGAGPDGLVYSGPMAAMGRTALSRFASHESRTYSFVVAMPDTGEPAGPLAGDNARQGGSVTVDYLWSADSHGAIGGRRCRHGMLGTSRPDHLSATRRGVRVLARGGDDRIHGSRATDCIFGGPGGDLELGRAGGDLLRGGFGDDVLRGGAGADRTAGRQGSDSIIGGPGRDGLRGGSGNDVIRAADGEADRIHCGIGVDFAVVDPTDRISDCERVLLR